MTKTLRARARRIKLLLLDVDGVLTDGRIYLLPHPRGGWLETKGFHSRDGLGIRLAHQAGLRTGIISGRQSRTVEQRSRELGIHYLRQDVLEKLEPYREILAAAQVTDEEVCFMGDDLVDLPLLKRVGLAIGVADGHPLLRRYVHYLTKAPGGAGAVREAVEILLTAQGKFNAVLRHYLR